MMSTALLVTTFAVLLNCVSGILTCGGCISGDIDNEYYCKGAKRYVYFRCESGVPQLEWNIYPLFESTVFLSALDEEDNVIRRGGATIFVDTTDVTSSKTLIISYLWLNLGEMDSELNVTCTNGGVFYWVLKPSGESTLKPNIKDAYVVKDPNSEEEITVFYKWDHPNFREILGYNVKTFLDGQLISIISLPKASVNGSHNVHHPNDGELSLEIEAVDHCNERHSSEIFTVSRSYIVSDESECLTSAQVDEYCASQTPSSTLTPSTTDSSSINNTAIIVASIALVAFGILAAAIIMLFIVLKKHTHRRINNNKPPAISGQSNIMLGPYRMPRSDDTSSCSASQSTEGSV
jgi:hypothetical protein